MTTHIAPSDFLLPARVHSRIDAFYALWRENCRGGLPEAAQFNLTLLSSTYPLLARIGMDAAGKTLMWRDVAHAGHWPFKTPVKGRPVLQSVPVASIKRVVAAFQQTLSSGIPDYYEATSWSNDGQTVSMARIAVPVSGKSGRELLAYWEVL
ncbi:hypothetical protein SAMN05877838_0548 [Hoeflea halophila]|uniref:PAS domain-containing protein n=1 Tax=Hoeflea halophila TaxID=714899 RepID=A0A286HM14_9HYPH|nr:hypothetical protein [Hoeflea halophila]SOE08818.1 hypothetical protein SAMN05877838_0548 [Hoeflea halophila]